MMLAAHISFFWFMLGVVATLLSIVAVKRGRSYYLSRRVKENIQEDLDTVLPENQTDQQALALINDCKRRLLLQKKINPDWVEPLKLEIPALIQRIAGLYFPETKNPLLAPDIGEFLAAVELVTADISQFLQSRTGRLLNVSGNTAHNTYRFVRDLTTNEKLKRLDLLYRKVRPLAQVLYYKSSVMWTFMIGRNIAIRTLQAKIVSIVGIRAMQLYSGKLKGGQ